MSRKLYFGLLTVILAIFMPVHLSFGRNPPPAAEGMETRLAWIERTGQSQAWGVMILMGSVLLLVAAYHISNRRLAIRSTGPSATS